MNINRGDIWWVDLEPVKGHEYEKKRPAIVINTNIVNSKSNFELRIIVPIVGWKQKYEYETWMVKLTPSPRNGLDKISFADPYQIRCVSEERFDEKSGRIGIIGKKQLTEIEDLLIAILDIKI